MCGVQGCREAGLCAGRWGPGDEGVWCVDVKLDNAYIYTYIIGHHIICYRRPCKKVWSLGPGGVMVLSYCYTHV